MKASFENAVKNALVVFVTILMLSIVGCSGQVLKPAQDSGPRGKIDVSRIPDTIAKPVTRTQAGNKSPYTVLGKTYAVLENSRGYNAEGLASWYGSKFHGRNTSNGEIFDMYSLTAAHKHLPIPTYAEVTNLENGRKVVVRINDRGPFHSDRIIDLSWAAAAKLGFADKGTARVKMVALDPDTAQLPTPARPPASLPKPLLPATQVSDVPTPSALPANSYYQIAVFSSRFAAADLAREAEIATKYPVRIDWDESSAEPTYKVLIGPVRDRGETHRLADLLTTNGMNVGFVVQL